MWCRSSPTADRSAVLTYLYNQGWLYLYDGRGIGPRPAEQLPTSLLGLEDDPYRSLVWKLKQEGWIKPQPADPVSRISLGRLAAQSARCPPSAPIVSTQRSQPRASWSARRLHKTCRAGKATREPAADQRFLRESICSRSFTFCT